MFGPRYAVIGVGIGALASHGLGEPESGTLEALLCVSGRSCVIPTHRGQGLPQAEIAALSARRTTNPGYFPFTPRELLRLRRAGDVGCVRLVRLMAVAARPRVP
jgi:hypothetical protein